MSTTARKTPRIEWDRMRFVGHEKPKMPKCNKSQEWIENEVALRSLHHLKILQDNSGSVIAQIRCYRDGVKILLQTLERDGHHDIVDAFKSMGCAYDLRMNEKFD